MLRPAGDEPIPFSIVIPSSNRADLLDLCLQSVIRFAPSGTEVIVVDDGSAGALVSRTAERFAGVRVLRNARKCGFCVAANRGIESARGRVVELLNDDTQVTAGWADSALRCFDDPTVGAVASLVLLGVPGDQHPRIDSSGDGYDAGGFAWKRGHLEPLSDSYLRAQSVSAASGSSVFLRREALVRTGLFPEHFGAYFEDVDLSLRLRAAGYRIQYEPASCVWHRGGGSYGQANRQLVEKQSCNEERLFWRNLDRTHPWPAIARHLAVLAGKAIRRWREGRFMPFVMGRTRALAELLWAR